MLCRSVWPWIIGVISMTCDAWIVWPFGVFMNASAVVNVLAEIYWSNVTVTNEKPLVKGVVGVYDTTRGPETPGGTPKAIPQAPRPNVDAINTSGAPLGIGRPELASIFPKERSRSVILTIGRPPP